MLKLFWSRLLLYAIAAGVPLFYPGVVVAYDRVSLLTYFGYVPLMMALAAFVRPPQWRLRTMLLWPLGLALVFSFFAGWNRDGLALTGVGLVVWTLTVLIFMGGYRGTGVAVLEVFALGAIYYRLLSFGRASEDVARAVSAWLVPLTVLAMVAFLLHGLLIYLAAFPDRSVTKRRREALIFFGSAVPVAVLLLMFLPVDFVRNDVVLNQFFEEPKTRELPADSFKEGEDDRGGPGIGEEQKGNGLPLGGRKSTEPRLPDGSTLDERSDTRIREYRPDEHRGGRGAPRRTEEGGQESGSSGQRPDSRDSGSKTEPQGKRENKSGGSERDSGKQESPKSGGSSSGAPENKSESGQTPKSEPAKPESGKSEGKSQSGKEEKNQPQSGKSEGKSESGKSQSQKSESGGGSPKSEDNAGGGQSGKKEENQKQESPKQEGGTKGEQNQKKEEKREPPKEKRENRLRGTTPDNYKPQWTRDTTQAEGDGGYQYALMIVASPVQPIYSAELYWNEFDGNTGFQASANDFYNQIGRARLLETWRNPNILPDEKRKAVEIRYLSAIPERVVPYLPELLEPTKLSDRYRPFDLSYRARALISTSGPEDWQKAPDLRASEQKDLALFLKADVSPEHKRGFQQALDRALRGKKTYYERMDAVHRMMTDYQYELGFDENTAVSKLHEFFTKTKTGDCTEFSHTTVLLARMAGIPARVVTGYVAGKDTQTPAHRRGLEELRKRIEPLQSIPLDQLYLVTSMHRHAWAQFYVPGYGWVDIEATAYAKPPKPQFDPNNRDVVIPLIEKEKVATPLTERRKIAWRTVAIVALFVVLAFLILLYLYRYGREAYLFIRSRGQSPRAMEALYQLSLLRLAARGYPLKEPFETPQEFARRVPELESLASRLNVYRFRERLSNDERQAIRREMLQSYRRIWKELRRGGAGLIRRVFSLRPLYY